MWLPPDFKCSRTIGEWPSDATTLTDDLAAAKPSRQEQPLLYRFPTGS